MKILGVLIILFTGLTAKDIDIKEFELLLKSSLLKHMVITDVYDHGSIYEVSIDYILPIGVEHHTRYVSKDKKIIFLGKAFDANTNTSIQKDIK